MSDSWDTKQAIRLGELCQESACARPRGVSNVLALVQSYSQGLTEVPLLTSVRGNICLIAS